MPSEPLLMLFAYDPERHGMSRETVPANHADARAAQLRAQGLEVSVSPTPLPPKDEAVTLLAEALQFPR